MREPKPFYRKQTRSYYVQVDDRQIPLGPAKVEAYRKWHLLMAGADEGTIAMMNEAAKPKPKTEPVIVKKLVKSYLGWQSTQRLANSTKAWYKKHLESFASVAGGEIAEKVTSG